MHRIYVQFQIPDARAKIKQKAFNSLGLKNNVGAVRVVDCYTIDAKLNSKQIQKAKMLLANPLVQTADESACYTAKNFDYAVETGYLPGVTDNVGSTAKETLSDGAKIKFKPGQSVYSSQVFFVYFNKNNRKQSSVALAKEDIFVKSDITKIAGSLYNPLIQRASIKTHKEFKQDGGMDIFVPKVKLSSTAKVTKVDLNVSDEELIKLGKLGIPELADKSADYTKNVVRPFMGQRRGPLALGLPELKAIREHFNKLGRKPTDIELETLGQTWSEHCKHTIFADPMDSLEKGIYKTYIKGATEKIREKKVKDKRLRIKDSPGDFCVSVFTDNSGGIIFDKDFLITHKVETHNTPSALDPFGGAITGIVGVNRDCLGFGLGAKPVINTYGFCFGEPDDKSVLYRDKNLTQPMLSSQRIMQGVIAGINSGGNQSGIPTNLGFMYFDRRFSGKPLVFAGTVGLVPRSINGKPAHIKQAKSGDLIVMVGGRVGQDGIHGATFSSETLDSRSPATAVQIGDPITQKKFSDALVKEARAQNLYSSITDCGAGGLSSAVGEMAQATGDPSGSSRAKPKGGCLVQLDKVPVKYPGLKPWQIWISESQERMVLAVPKKRWLKLQLLLKNRGVEATAIGAFTNSGKCVIKFKNQTVLDLDLNFLHNGRPVKQQTTKKPVREKMNNAPKLEIGNWKLEILSLLSRLNIAGNDFVSTQYDHEVQGGSVLKPLQGRGRISAEATVTRPVLTSPKGVVLSCALNPSFSELNPYNMAACAIDGAVRAAVAAGANVDYLALLDNFCWCSPEDPKRLWQLKEAARACFDVATAYGTPFISGKDSMYNDFKGFTKDGKPLKISIPPTLLISAIGVIPDASKAVSLDAKLAGDAIYILGETHNELGGSEYLRMTQNFQFSILNFQSPTPSVNAEKNYHLYKTIFTANQQNLLASAISCGRGGLVAALAKTLAGGALGAEINLALLPGGWTENYQALFSESQGRILVTVAPQNIENFEKLMIRLPAGRQGHAFANLGKTTAKPVLKINDKKGREIVNLKIADALKAYKSTFKDF